MKQITIVVHCSLGLEDREEEITVDVPDSASHPDIELIKEEAAREWAFNLFEWNYWDKDNVK